MFTLEHWVFLYEPYVMCNCSRKSKRKFRKRFSSVWLLDRNAISDFVIKIRSRSADVLTETKPKCWVKSELDLNS